jgi:hypothetical protein
MKRIRRFLMKSAVLIIFVAGVFSLFSDISYAQTVVIGERVEFLPSNPRPGETVRMAVHFRVEVPPETPMASVRTEMSFTTDPRLIDGRSVGGIYFQGSHTLSFAFIIPDPAPQRICFNVYAHFPGTGLTSALLIHNACLNARFHLASLGTGQRVVIDSPPGSPPGSSSTITGRFADFNYRELSPRGFDFFLTPFLQLEGAPIPAGFTFMLDKDGDDFLSITMSTGLNPGDNRPLIHWTECDYGGPCIPSRFNLNLKISRDSRPWPSDAQLLIGDIRIENRMYVLSAGTGQRITLPSRPSALLPDLTVGDIRVTRTPSFVGKRIKIPISFRIENIGEGAAGPFWLSIICQYPSSYRPYEDQVEFTGTSVFSGLGPSRRVSALDISGDVIILKGWQGRKVKIRAFVDSTERVTESNEENNRSPWHEVQLPSIFQAPPKSIYRR